jgi:hypothetical protein
LACRERVNHICTQTAWAEHTCVGPSAWTHSYSNGGNYCCKTLIPFTGTSRRKELTNGSLVALTNQVEV